jgi:CubicO group peptidase (beta-lactamase class C family)
VIGQDKALEKKVDEYLRPVLDMDLISGSVLIARKGEILLAKGYGPSNREYDIPNTPETKFRLGSMTKQFTAMAIMILMERELLDVGDPISKFYPEYLDGDKITVHHLLTHTSGIPNYNNLAEYGEKLMLSWDINRVVDWFKGEPLQFEPGERFAYSNSGYVLLAWIIEHLSGVSYADFLRANIFEPLGMHNSGQDVYTTVLENRATGHIFYGEEIMQAPYRDMGFTSGAGSLYSTIMDLFLWDQALYKNTLITLESRKKMFTPEQQTYAYGWFVQELYDRPVITHRGAINGFMTNIDRLVDDSLLIVALFNYETLFSYRIRGGLAAVALGLEHKPLLVDPPIEVPAEILQTYTGQYQVTPEIIITVTLENGNLFVQEPDAPRRQGSAQSENMFFFRDMNAFIRFDSNEEGEINRMTIQQGAHNFRAAKI